jgi:hypothetical protein
MNDGMVFLTVIYGMDVSMVDFYGICGTVVGWNPMGMFIDWVGRALDRRCDNFF